MKIDRVTITGADNNVLEEDLLLLSKRYPFVEWGILFSVSKEGQPRYPTFEWIDSFVKLDTTRSAHYCGWYCSQILEAQKFELLDLAINRGFKRIQINYNFNYNSHWKLQPLWDWMYEHPKTSIILQWNKTNSAAITTHCNGGQPPNLHLLYDSSGGRGKVIESIGNPFQNYTSYSGGLSPDNIKSFLEMVKNFNGYSQMSIGCDMESGVRTNNKFDMSKVEQVLEISSPYINQNV